jgi:hypothetical protein
LTVRIVIRMSPTELFALAWELDARGFAGQEAAVRRVVRAARAHGVSRVAAEVLADPTEPAVARLRAFGSVAAALARADLGTRPSDRLGSAA